MPGSDTGGNNKCGVSKDNGWLNWPSPRRENILKDIEKILLISFVSLLSFPVLYICRFLDNNTLSSWQWVFNGDSVAAIMAWLLAAAVFSAFITYKIPIEKTPPVVLALFAVLVVVPLWWEPELLLDSGRYFIQAKYLSTRGITYFLQEWGHEIPAWTDLPLLPFIYGVIFKIIGETRMATQLFTTFLFGATVFLGCRIGKRLWNTEVGFYAGILLLGLPYLLTQVPLLLVDIPAMFLLTLSLAVFLRGLAVGGWGLVWASFVILLTMLAKYSTWPMLPVLPLAALVYKSDDRSLVLKRAGAILLTTGILAALIMFINRELFRQQLQILMTYQRPALKLWHEGFISTFFFQFHPFIILLAGGAIYRGYVKRDGQILIAAFGLILIAALNIQRIRYLIPLLPLLALMAASGLQIIRVKEIRRFVALIIISSSLVYLYAGYLSFFKRTSMMNIGQAAAYIDKLPGEMVEVYTLPQKKSGGNTALAISQLDIFTQKKLISRQDWQLQERGKQQTHAPLLFSWKISRPSYYQPPGQVGNVPLVIISADPVSNADIPAAIIGKRKIRQQFSQQSNVFRYKTLVHIYQ